MAIRLWAVWLLLALLIIPPTFFENAPGICMYHRMTGKKCPACGLTRACSLLMHGEYENSMSYHRGVIFVVPLLILIALIQLGGLFLRKTSLRRVRKFYSSGSPG